MAAPRLQWPLRAVFDQVQRETIDAGLGAAVCQFYDDYEDADSVIGCDLSFYRALEKIATYGNEEIDDIIECVQQQMTSETGRRFKRALDDDD